jgi:hypothetical protein
VTLLKVQFQFSLNFKFVWALPSIELKCIALGFGLRLTEDFRGLKVENSVIMGCNTTFDIMRIHTMYCNKSCKVMFIISKNGGNA